MTSNKTTITQALPSTALEFLSNDADENEGLGDAGIEIFKDAPYAGVARECGQNSIDVRVTTPVIMRFDLLRIPTEDYPIHTAQLSAVEQCLQKATHKGDDKEIEFFTRAKHVLQQDQIVLLRIEDENTKGLAGPAVEGTPFHALVKSNGVSNKDSDESGGSFGIGKKAAFAVSELHTVFYSTVYADSNSGNPPFLAQGKTILMSHTDENGKNRRATGYWGMPGFLPVTDTNAAPEWLRRSKIGTSVVVAGFRESPDWQYRITVSLLKNFFCALSRGEIRFYVNNGAIDLHQGSIDRFFNDPDVLKAAEDTDETEDFEFARHLYSCLQAQDSIKKVLKIPGLGDVGLTILIKEQLPKRVQIVRNGMSITGELSSFGEKLANFPRYKDFVAVVEPQSHDGRKLFKRMENPQHNSLSAERLADPEKKKSAKVTMKRLAKEIRGALKEAAYTPPEPQVTLDELSEFFDVPDNDGSSPREDANPEIRTYARADPRRAPSGAPETVTGTGSSGGGGTRSGRGSGAGRAGSGKGRGTGGSGKKANSGSMELKDFRNVTKAGGGAARELFFTPSELGPHLLQLFAAGVDQPTALKVRTTSAGTATAGKISIDIVDLKRVHLSIMLDEQYPGPIELIATKP